MKTLRSLLSLAAVISVLGGLSLAGAQARADAPSVVTVQVGRPGFTIPSTLFGLFFEDVNFGADGGLYPERVKNRSFEFPDALMGWKPAADGGARGSLKVLDDTGERPNDDFLRITAETDGYGVTNEGFRGVGVEQGAEYHFSVVARRSEGDVSGLRITVEDGSGRSLGEARVKGLTPEWKEYSATLKATEGAGTVDVDQVSLFPKATWKGRKNGLRADLVRLLREMKPGFMRFPGGCIIEGRVLDERYQWKATVGEPEDRRLLVNRWNMEFRHRPAPDYYQSFGLGFFEYFQLCEDIGAEPLPVLNCGMACQFNSGQLAPLSALEPYVQDALDLIEFANGPVSSRWGRVRAEMGHPAPFKLKLIGVGNEQWGPQYIDRYRVFQRVLNEKHPEIRLISSAGPAPSGPGFQMLWTQLRQLKADIVDEHYYQAPRWFRENVGRYDDYPRTGPKVFAGEYAAQSVGIARPENRNNWECALSEAAFMTGLERNADVVEMSSYAPLFGHVDGWQWTPNLIWFDNLRSYGTPNYYVQKLFSTNRGTALLPVTMEGSAKNGQGELFTVATQDEKAREVVLTLVNTSASARELRVRLEGARRTGDTATAQVLASADLKAENSLDAPTKLAPVTRKLPLNGDELGYRAEPYSVTVLRFPAVRTERDASAGQYEIRENVEYSNDPVPLKLDAHIPPGKGPFPAVILVHGGGWVTGDKTASFIKPLFPVLDRTGFAWFSIDYRLAPRFPYTAMVEDVERAIVYVKQHARELKVDPKKIALMGESAGGHLVNLVGARNRPPADVAAVVSFYGPWNLPDTLRLKPGSPPSEGLKGTFRISALDAEGMAKIQEASPERFLTPRTPPFLFIHGTKDPAVPYEQSLLGMELFKKAGLRSDLITVQDGVHGVINWESDPKFQGYKQQMIDWLRRVLKS
jgi:alpha-N-arabinofuranosidase